MKISRFEDILAWQKAGKLTLDIYDTFKNCKDFGFKSQIERASVSIMNNIAEGFERKSNKEFKYFLFISKGSSGEIRSMLYIALRLQYINSIKFIKLKNDTEEISKMLSGLIKTL
jgi:four helix bundle protein